MPQYKCLLCWKWLDTLLLVELSSYCRIQCHQVHPQGLVMIYLIYIILTTLYKRLPKGSYLCTKFSIPRFFCRLIFLFSIVTPPLLANNRLLNDHSFYSTKVYKTLYRWIDEENVWCEMLISTLTLTVAMW